MITPYRSLSPSVPVSYTHLDVYKRQALNDLVTVGSKIVVHRVDYRDKVETQTIPYDTVYVYTSLYYRNTGRTTTCLLYTSRCV